MTTTVIKTGLGIALTIGLALSVPVANAQIMSAAEVPEGISIMGLGMGAVPDYMGSAASKRGAIPVLRYQFYDDTYFLLHGTQASLNLTSSEHWRYGPMINYRAGRGSSVEDATVKRMVGINGKAEAGVFLAYSTTLGHEKTHQIKFTGDIAGGNNGTVGNLRMTYTLQLGAGHTLSVGVGTTIASDRWMQQYFGITNASDIALYPSLAGLPFNASGGVKGSNISLSLTQALSKTWLMSFGFHFEKLMNGARNSPVTSQSGKSNQWTNSVVLSYVF